MARVAAGEVKEIVTTSLSDGVVTTSMIETANALVNAHVDLTQSASILKAIELYLAAHFVAITSERGGLTATELGDSSDKFSDNYSAGLGSTRYGQQALTLDASGGLSTISTARLKSTFRVV